MNQPYIALFKPHTNMVVARTFARRLGGELKGIVVDGQYRLALVNACCACTVAAEVIRVPVCEAC